MITTLACWGTLVFTPYRTLSKTHMATNGTTKYDYRHLGGSRAGKANTPWSGFPTARPQTGSTPSMIDLINWSE